MLAAQSPMSGNQMHHPKSGRNPLQPKNSPATPINDRLKSKQQPRKWIEIMTVATDDSNKENIDPLLATPAKTKESSLNIEQQKKNTKTGEPSLNIEQQKKNVHHISVTNPAKTESLKIEQFDASLAEELSAIREKLQRLKVDKEKTEKILRDRDTMLNLQMNELLKRGEEQKLLEMEVDRLFRLKELRLSCMRILPIRPLREKVKTKKMDEEYESQDSNSIGIEESRDEKTCESEIKN